MQERLMRRTAVLTALFAVAAMALMFYYSSVKVIVIAEEASDTKEETAAKTHLSHEGGQPLQLREQSDSPYLYISLPGEVTAEHIFIDNQYMDGIVEIGIEGVNESYYTKEIPYGRCDGIKEAVYTMQEEKLRMCFMLDDTYEVEYVYEAGRLSVRFVSPDTLYDRIVILDTVDTGRSGNVSEVTALVRAKLEAENIKVYDVSTPAGYEADKKTEIVNELKGDMYVALELGEEESAEHSGMEAFYNDEFFIPFVSNVTLADMVLRESAAHTDGRANGLFIKEDTDAVLAGSQIPSTKLRLGYRENRNDMERLRSEEYRERLAEGIKTGIMKCYAVREQYESDEP